MDFLLPLWAAADIGATPAAIGLVVAIEAGTSLAVRPVAGILADRANRQLVAAVGAALYAVAFVVYALAPGIVVVGLGAAVGGAGGALFWVALRADVGARSEQDPAAYARLLSSEQAGSLAAFVVGLSLLGSIGYRPLFLVGAAACGAAMVLLLGGRGTARPRCRDGLDGRTGLRHLGGRLAPLLAVTALTAGAESGLALVLLLHLQAAFELEPQEIALLFLPGAIVLVVLPERAYELAIRLGRARSMMFSLVAGALFTASLALVDTPLVVAALWMLCAAAIATALPVEQATVAQASAGSLGRGVGLYEMAALLGALIASPVLAAVYGGQGWRIACAIAAAGFVLGAALVPLVVRMLGLSDRGCP
jgi:MFS family permease